MRVPIWFQGWEVGCCLRDLSVGDQFETQVGLVVATATTTKPSIASSIRKGRNGRVDVVGLAAPPPGNGVGCQSTVEVGGVRLTANRVLRAGPDSVSGWICSARHDSHGNEPLLAGVVTSIGFFADGPANGRYRVSTFPGADGRGPLEQVASTSSREDVGGPWVIEIETAATTGTSQRPKRR